MATSGTRTFTLYVNEIIEEAYSRIGGETITGKESSSARVTNADGTRTDFEMERISRDDYLRIPDKETSGRPSQYFVDKQITPVIFLYPTPDSADTFRYKERKALEDITAATESVDIPNRFLPCAISGLAYYLSLKRPQIEMQRRQELKMLYEEEFLRAMQDNREKVDLKITPDLRYSV
jgi:hypothetical protein